MARAHADAKVLHENIAAEHADKKKRHHLHLLELSHRKKREEAEQQAHEGSSAIDDEAAASATDPGGESGEGLSLKDKVTGASFIPIPIVLPYVASLFRVVPETLHIAYAKVRNSIF